MITDPDAKLKIDILLKEYDTLRNEIISRTKSRFLTISLVGGALAFVGSQTKVPWYLDSVSQHAQFLVVGLVVLALMLVIAATFWRQGSLIKRCAGRIAELEKHVNKLADDDLLRWESRIAIHGFFHRIYRYPLRYPRIPLSSTSGGRPGNGG